ncbi:hypothetical protein OGM63_08430 [Plectonema radiosum NIES-515]|uniref:Uncharacterized protein n=1 Tax=Plectonema radiosum NIES-515 TaxID=2986073 RepID=A0ABT3AWZ0_9CYAN|nr:hypothetical protein [Plectonema radiosum]MCV3213550.1 hypothetical protein [Plectonema radiosum NIES-515]
MTQVNYAAMTDQELKRYILAHRDDQQAFYIYMDRRHSRPDKVVIKFDDPNWEAKVLAAIQEKLDQNI